MPLHAPIACHSSPEISSPAPGTVFRDDSAAARTTDAGRVRLGGYAPPLAPRPLNADTVERTWAVAPMRTWAPGTALHARLVTLWVEGHSTAEIGRRLGYTKNAIVGAVHRNHLTPRPSPIGAGARLGYNRVRSVPQLAHVPLPSLAELVGASPLPLPPRGPAHIRTRRIFPAKPAGSSPAPVVHHPRAIAIAITQRAAAELPPPPAPVLEPRFRLPVEHAPARHDCCWPIGEPGTREFRFCDGVSQPGKPYCHSHCLIAYVGTGRWLNDNDRSLQRADADREVTA